MENLNSTDRIVRSAIGTVLLLIMLTLADSSTMIAAMAFASLYPLLTALLAWDPAYQLVMSLAPRLFKSSDIKPHKVKTAF